VVSPQYIPGINKSERAITPNWGEMKDIKTAMSPGLRQCVILGVLKPPNP
jgi:hypothetical protein